MELVLCFAIAHLVLYAVVWLHEIGHALWYRRYGLKRDWWKVQVKPYLFFSTPGAVDEDAWQALEPMQVVSIAYGGIMANALFAVLSGALILALRDADSYLQLALWLFMTFHMGELVSYLLVGSIILVSDMKLVHTYLPGARVPNILVGTIILIAYLYVLSMVPEGSKLFVLIWNAATVISMCAGRIVSTARTERAARD